MLSCENLETLMVWNEASKFSALHNAICGLLEDFQLIRYELLSVKVWLQIVLRISLIVRRFRIRNC